MTQQKLKCVGLTFIKNLQTLIECFLVLIYLVYELFEVDFIDSGLLTDGAGSLVF